MARDLWLLHSDTQIFSGLEVVAIRNDAKT